jgi:quercetin dioxygenase-like cupin family protein
VTLKMRDLVVDGTTWGTIYFFEKAGDEFPVHVHDERTNHITIVTSGAIRFTGHPNHDGKIAAALPGGTIVNWRAGEPHGFVAEVDDTTIINLRKRRP